VKQTRRKLMIAGGMAGLGLTGCFGPAAASLSIKADGRPGLNPGLDGADRPLTLSIIQMSGTGAFDSADFFALQNPQAALGGEFVRMDQLVVTGGASTEKVITIQTGASAVGIVGGFRSPGGKVFRSRITAPSRPEGVVITVGSGGISLASV